ncbi:unnamed protein product, partial [Nesidiocoris tenuis]
MYINELGSLDIQGKIMMFADDTVLFFSSTGWERAFQLAEEGMKTVYAWLVKNKLTLNVNKTAYIAFTLTGTLPVASMLRSHLPTCDFPNCQNCPIVKRENEVKYLGVIFDCNMKWKSQVAKVNNGLRKLIYIFVRMKKVASLQVLRMVYFALVQSILLYGLPAWGSAYPTVIEPIVRTQKMLVRAVANERYRAHTSPLFRRTNIMKFVDLKKASCVRQIIKENSFIRPQHDPPTRFQYFGSMALPRCATTAAQNNYRYFGAKVYNGLPTD